MKNIENQIINSIEYSTSSLESANFATIHWRWSQFERIRRAQIRQGFKGLSITNTEEYSVLVFISHAENPSAHDITDYLCMERSTVSEFIKRCVRRQLILEEPCVADKRKKYYRLTPLGLETLEQAHKRMEVASESLFSGLSQDAQNKLITILGTLRTNQ